MREDKTVRCQEEEVSKSQWKNNSYSNYIVKNKNRMEKRTLYTKVLSMEEQP